VSEFGRSFGIAFFVKWLDAHGPQLGLGRENAILTVRVVWAAIGNAGSGRSGHELMQPLVAGEKRTAD
jgi:hypothetical protein